MGMVLIDFTPHKDIRRWYEPIKAEWLIDFLFHQGYWLSLDDGSQSPTSLIDNLQGKEKNLLADFFTRYMALLHPYPHTDKILPECREKGINLYYLTNFPDEMFAWVQNQFSWLRHFTGGVVSSRVKLVKPDPRIYQLLCDQEKIIPAETLFIDDRKDNVAAANESGFQTRQLTDPNDLTGILKETLRE